MSMPVFRPGDDPGPDFVKLLERTGRGVERQLPGQIDAGHATTVLALRTADGVVMAGDRRATSGHLISRRTMTKVFEADRHSGVAIAGAAGPAIEMVRIFQVQLEHYEKVEGKELSLDGKANQLSGMIRGNLPAAMQGLAVVPIFAGYDRRRGHGRLYEFDVTGGRYEDRDFATSGSGSLHAGTVLKLGFEDAMSTGAAIDLALSSLWHAADEDSATGGPDPIRGIYPVVATITAEGFQLVDEADLATRVTALTDGLSGRLGTAGEGN